MTTNKNMLMLALGTVLACVPSVATAQVHYYMRSPLSQAVSSVNKPAPSLALTPPASQTIVATPEPTPTTTPTPPPVVVTYMWHASTWSDWDSHCSSTAKRTRAFICVSSQDVVSSDSKCTTVKPVSTDIDAVFDQCPAQTDQCTSGIVGMSATSAGSATQDGVSLLSEGMTTQSDLSAWRIRNSNTTSRKVTIASHSGGWTLTFNAPAKMDVYVVSGVGRITHKLTSFGSNQTTVTGVETKNANNSPFDKCR